jgi:hypothetical protein
MKKNWGFLCVLLVFLSVVTLRVFYSFVMYVTLCCCCWIRPASYSIALPGWPGLYRVSPGKVMGGNQRQCTCERNSGHHLVHSIENSIVPLFPNQ